MFKLIQFLILFIAAFSMDLWAGTCTSISRTANAANSVLTSTKYNLDHSTSYAAINAADGGCINTGSLEKDALNTTDFQVVQSAPKTGCALNYHNASTVRVGPCRIAIDNDYTVTTTGSTVAFGCSGCSAEVATTSYYVYATTASATNSLDLLISTSAPADDGYSGTSRVIGKFFNQGNSDISTSDVVSYAIGNLEPQVAYIRYVLNAGTHGGNATSGSWETRPINNLTGDASVVTTLASNRFTLPAGVYDIDAKVPGYLCDRFQAKLVNITDTLDTAIGTSAFVGGAAGYSNSHSFINVRLALTAAKVFEIQGRVETTAAKGFGLESNFGVTEIYTTVKITKWR